MKRISGVPGAVRVLAACLLWVIVAGAAFAQSERYQPNIWVDPDGCEHWVMDDGWEGYMANHLDRDGRPVCREINVCGVMNSDTLFATGSSRLGSEARRRLNGFFGKADAFGYIIIGHTDSRGSDAFNMRLSERRARSVAEVALAQGARVVDVRGMGERAPVAANDTPANMRRNRRVEIQCLR